MIAVVDRAAWHAWIASDESRAIYDAHRTGSITDGTLVAARASLGLCKPDGCPAACYVTLAEAMAAHPGMPWHLLPTWSGDAPEPELAAARAEYAASNPAD